jgi:hypothetical protein
MAMDGDDAPASAAPRSTGSSARPAAKPAPNMADMDDDIPF